MVKTLLFDCDDTLVASEELAFTACCSLVNEVLAGKNVDRRFTPDELKSEFVGCSFRRMITELAAQHEFALADDELESLVTEEEDRVIAILSEKVEPTEGVNELLASLSTRFGLAVVSSSALRRVRTCLDRAGQAGFFQPDHVFSAASSLAEPTSKPDPAVYKHSLDILELDAEDCAAVEDSTSGVKAAVAAGIAVIGYVGAFPEDRRADRTQELLEAGAQVVIESWDEFDEALASLEATPC